VQLNDVYVDEQRLVYTMHRFSGGLYLLEFLNVTPWIALDDVAGGSLQPGLRPRRCSDDPVIGVAPG
jgi:hypothetical protein